MSGESELKSTGGYIPKPDCSVYATTSEFLSIRTETHAMDAAGMSGEGAFKGALSRTPQPENSVAMPTDERLSIRAETHAHDIIGGTEREVMGFGIGGEDGEQRDFAKGCRIVEPNSYRTRNG